MRDNFRSSLRQPRNNEISAMITSVFLNEPLAAYASATAISPERVGEISEDRSAVVGLDGWCFIYEGSNNYRGSYQNMSLAPLGDQWARLIEERQRICDALGARFVQLIIPNKATLMPVNFPEPLEAGITKVLERLLDAAPKANLLCPVEQMRQPSLREVIFRRNDSHLTVAGNALLAELVLEAVGVAPISSSCIEVLKVNHTGDLGGKFSLPISESIFAPRFDTGLLDEQKIEKIDETIVEGFNGNQQTFSSLGTPIKKTILVIGNSFFERTPGWGMSPIFAAIFDRFSFYWSSDFKIELIHAYKPDIVIAQTCERFLTKLPFG